MMARKGADARIDYAKLQEAALLDVYGGILWCPIICGILMECIKKDDRGKGKYFTGHEFNAGPILK